MYARSTTISGDPQALDRGIAYVRDEVMPAVQDMAGCLGLSMLADRGSGRCIVTTSWRDREAMQASAEGVRSMRDRAAEVFEGGFEVREWEIAAMHRRHEAHHGACTRVTWLRGEPDGMERSIEGFRTTLAPRLDDLPGFCSVSLMTHTAEGMAVAAVTYDSREDMVETRGQAQALRDELAPALGLAVTEVAEFDLVLAHLRVPETV
ncbi:Antibiotic biosynthesis monooxygenase [Geodermatophilus pulveris]|uniref:Antibiotic biosynthesis monooxygenase n=1 Tax=Geodermatophilus pulveris TaxID=1564159 RepID=A0A239I844_9ACTN|nr:antibiotic biosynthesis monooxygenase [Geodermatophilus pulveris]SNS89729.1 Antibiotic biosynthesis monooxygenase [Geodermatophilus pulveris]